MVQTRKKSRGRSISELRNEQTFILASTKVHTAKKGTITPRMILAFLDKNPGYLPSITEYGDYLIEADIFRCRLILWQSKSKQKTYLIFQMIPANRLINIQASHQNCTLIISTFSNSKNRIIVNMYSKFLCNTTTIKTFALNFYKIIS